MSWVAAIAGSVALTAGAVKAGVGAHQKKVAKRWLSSHPEVTEPLNKELVQNQQLAQIRSNTGLPSEQYNIAMKNIQNQQLLALKKASLLGGGKALGIVGGVNEQGNNAVGNLDAMNANARLRNEGQLINVNARLAYEKARLFNANVREPDLRIRYAKYNELNAGQQNIAAGLDQMASGGGQIASGFAGGGGNTNTTKGNKNSQYMRMYWGG